MKEKNADEIKTSVQDYYGKTLQKGSDLKTNACCTAVHYPDQIKNIMSKIHDEVITRYYGCGLTIPHDLKGLSVLDLGSGAGRDCYILSSLVGEEGRVVGVDMTEEQLEVANRHLDYHQEVFGHSKSNISFLKGDIEKLDFLNLPDESFDVVVSNCVINLASDKKAVLKEVHRLLKPGGEMYFSDVYSSRRIPKELAQDEVLWGECLSGALYWNDFNFLSKEVGFTDPRLVEDAPITVENEELEKKLVGLDFYSATYRLFKADALELGSEDFGQKVTYNGGLQESQDHFILDQNNIFKKNESTSVSGNTFSMLQESRFSKYFDFSGDFKTHYGVFKDSSQKIPYQSYSTKTAPSKGGCC